MPRTPEAPPTVYVCYVKRDQDHHIVFQVVSNPTKAEAVIRLHAHRLGATVTSLYGADTSPHGLVIAYATLELGDGRVQRIVYTAAPFIVDASERELDAALQQATEQSDAARRQRRADLYPPALTITGRALDES